MLYTKFPVALMALFVIAFATTQVAAESATKEHTHAPTATATTSTAQTDLSAKPKTKLKTAANETVIYVKDLHCKHCAKSLASKLYTVKGVVKVRTDLKADVAIITPQGKKQLDAIALWKAAKKSGFPALKLEGPTGNYVADPKTQAAQLVPEKTATPQS